MVLDIPGCARGGLAREIGGRCDEEGGRPADPPADEAAVGDRAEAHFEIQSFLDHIRALLSEE